MLLSRDQILDAQDLVTDKVEVPEWGGSVLVRVMSGATRDRFEKSLEKDPSGNVRARLAALSICDESGELLFSDADLVALGKKSAPALDRVFKAVARLNAIGKESVDAMEKNSEGRGAI